MTETTIYSNSDDEHQDPRTTWTHADYSRPTQEGGSSGTEYLELIAMAALSIKQDVADFDNGGYADRDGNSGDDGYGTYSNMSRTD